MNKISLQISLERNHSNFSYIFLMYVKFENLTTTLHIIYILFIHVKFHLNQMLFTIQSINLFYA